MDRITLDRIKPLLRKYIDGSLSEDENRILEVWANAEPANRSLMQRIADPEQLENDLRLLQRSNSNILTRLQTAIPELQDEKTVQVPVVHRIHFLRRGFVKYAAAVVLIAGVAGWIWFASKSSKQDNEGIVVQDQQMIQPGGNKAVLTLADGTTIILDSSANGAIAQQGNTTIEKTSNGAIRYHSGSASGAVMNNTMRTPTGGQYQLTLPDGTRVWLNAESSITYPVAFNEQERKVTITGEAYFETAKDPSKPFLVNVNNRSTITVLGTAFNVNAYDNESLLTTTLLSGSVQVQSDQQKLILKPGQQSLQLNNNAISIAPTTDLERAIAWKNGKFDFNGLDLPAVMRQLERWYDIKVEFTGLVSKETFRGRLTRDLNLTQVLGILGNMDVKYRLEGRKLILY
jgi:ferric-dicitrate binding protein FerR (iron transport regulator)